MSVIPNSEMPSINEGLFTALPERKLNHIIHNIYKNKLKSSIIALLENANHSFNSKFDTLVNNFKTINVQKKLTPFIYFYYFKLLKNIKQNNVEQVHNILEILSESSNDLFYQDKYTIEHIQSEHWEIEVIDLYIQYSPINSIVKFNKISDAELIKQSQYVNSALQIIKESDEDFYTEFNQYVSKIKLHRGEVIVGATSPDYFGGMYISTPYLEKKFTPEIYYCEHIVHETSHLHLHAIMALDKLILNDNSELYKAPIRKDLRPLYGIYHATFVLSRMVRIFKKIVELQLSNNQSEAILCLEDFTNKFWQGYEVLQKNAKFTNFGEKIFLSMVPCANI